MADDRQIIFKSHMTPLEADSMESGAINTILLQKDASANYVRRSLGGKGTVTDLTDNQWSDFWTSITQTTLTCENIAAVWESGDSSSYATHTWNGTTTVQTAHQLTQGLSGGTDVDVSYLFIKNTGVNKLLVSLNGTSGNYFLEISGGSAISLRGGDTGFHADDIYVKTEDASVSSTIDWVLAKK